MKYNIIGYSNQVIGQVEARDAIGAWSEARKRFKNVLDVREAEKLSAPRPGSLFTGAICKRCGGRIWRDPQSFIDYCEKGCRHPHMDKQEYAEFLKREAEIEKQYKRFGE